jgi:hypothetical protein
LIKSSEDQVALILFAQTMFGIVFVIRTMHVFRVRGLLRQDYVTKTGTFFVTILCLARLWRVDSPITQLFSCAISMCGPLIFCLIGERIQLRSLRARVPLFLDRWILNMKIGNSLSSARDAALREETENFQALVRPLFEAPRAGPPRHSFLSSQVVRELQNIVRSEHSGLARLQNLRQFLKKSDSFRRKSGQAVRQTAIQSAIMTVLLVALSLFTIRKYGWARSADLIGLATLLSTTGVLLMVHLSRKSKWKL